MGFEVCADSDWIYSAQYSSWLGADYRYGIFDMSMFWYQLDAICGHWNLVGIVVVECVHWPAHRDKIEGSLGASFFFRRENMTVRDKRLVIPVSQKEKEYISNVIQFTGHDSVAKFVRDSLFKICDCIYSGDKKEILIVTREIESGKVTV